MRNNPHFPPAHPDQAEVTDFLFDSIMDKVRSFPKKKGATWQTIADWRIRIGDAPDFAMSTYPWHRFKSGFGCALTIHSAERTGFNGATRGYESSMMFSVPSTIRELAGCVRVPEEWGTDGDYTLARIIERPDILREYVDTIVVHELVHVQDKAARFRHHRVKYLDRPGEIRAYARQWCAMMRPPADSDAARGAWFQREVHRVTALPTVARVWSEMSPDSQRKVLGYVFTYAQDKGWLDD